MQTPVLEQVKLLLEPFKQGRDASLYIEPCGCGPWISNSLSALDFLLSCPLISLPSGPQSPCLCLTLPSPSGAISFYLRSPSFPHPALQHTFSPPHLPQYSVCLSLCSTILFPSSLYFSLSLSSLSVFHLSLSLSVLACLFSSLPFFPAPYQSHPHPLIHNLTTFLRSLIAL